MGEIVHILDPSPQSKEGGGALVRLAGGGGGVRLLDREEHESDGCFLLTSLLSPPSLDAGKSSSLGWTLMTSAHDMQDLRLPASRHFVFPPSKWFLHSSSRGVLQQKMCYLTAGTETLVARPVSLPERTEPALQAKLILLFVVVVILQYVIVIHSEMVGQGSEVLGQKDRLARSELKRSESVSYSLALVPPPPVSSPCMTLP